jgi:hypothetical protein
VDGLRFLKSMAMIAVILLASNVWAQRGHGRQGAGAASPPGRTFEDGGPQRQGRGMRRPGPHMGDWLRQHSNLSPEEQQRALEEDPNFRRLPAERQERLRRRLQKFNSLAPEQKQAILRRMETWEHLTPEQQERARDLFHGFRQLPPERRHALSEAFHELRDLSPEERQKALDTDRFRNNFSQQERSLLRGMNELGLAPLHHPQPPGPPPKE